MNLPAEAQQRVYEIVDTAIRKELEGDASREFILAYLNTDPNRYFSRMLFGGDKTPMQSRIDSTLDEIMKEILAEIFNKDFRAKLKQTLLDAAIEEKVLFAGKAAVSEFIDRVKAPIQGDLIKIQLFNSADEDDDE